MDTFFMLCNFFNYLILNCFYINEWIFQGLRWSFFSGKKAIFSGKKAIFSGKKAILSGKKAILSGKKAILSGRKSISSSRKGRRGAFSPSVSLRFSSHCGKRSPSFRPERVSSPEALKKDKSCLAPTAPRAV
jgi:hypothetical protein